MSPDFVCWCSFEYQPFYSAKRESYEAQNKHPEKKKKGKDWDERDADISYVFSLFHLVKSDVYSIQCPFV